MPDVDDGPEGAAFRTEDRGDTDGVCHPPGDFANRGAPKHKNFPAGVRLTSWPFPGLAPPGYLFFAFLHQNAIEYCSG